MIEAKSADTTPRMRHLDQAELYAAEGNHPWAVLTNGVVRNVARCISITKVQRRTAAAVELIALCQTITADGRLTDAEVIALEQWLIDSERVDLPAKKTDGERDELYVYLARDPASPFSANATEIRLSNGMQIGFVPETDARDMAPELDSGCPHRDSEMTAGSGELA